MKLLHPNQNILFLDFETTGIFGKNYSNIDVVETALVLYENYGSDDVKISSYEQLYCPRKKMNPFAQELTGLSDEMLQGKPSFTSLKSDLNSFVQKADVIVAHSAAIEVKALSEAGIDLSHARIFDTQAFAMVLFPKMPKPNLTNLAKHFDITLSRAHRAMEDVEATVGVYQHMTTNLWTSIPAKRLRRGGDFTYKVNKKED